MTAIEVRRLAVRFGPVEALVDLDLSVAAGASVAVVGRNGAGKSTLLRVLSGVLPASDGEIFVDGVNVRRDPTAAKERTGYCPDVGGLIPRATPWEHLQLAASLRRLPPGWEQRGEDLLDRFDLRAAADRLVSGFSHGMGRRMSVVLAAFHQPSVLLLDEPFDGVDPLGVDAAMQMIREARLAGAAVIVSTHLLSLAVEACEEAVVLRQGRVVAASPAAELAGDEGAARYWALLS